MKPFQVELTRAEGDFQIDYCHCEGGDYCFVQYQVTQQKLVKMKTKKDKQNMTESIRVKEANKAEEHEVEDEILKTMYYSIKPMGAEDAKLLLEDQPQNRFLTFVNIETGKVNVIYKLKDNKNFGLIEPEEQYILRTSNKACPFFEIAIFKREYFYTGYPKTKI